MDKEAQTLLKDSIIFHGSANKPMPPGTVFATIPPQDELASILKLDSITYPPLACSEPGCSFNPEDRTLKSTVWGRYTLTEAGISIKPSWTISEDKMLASVSVNRTDFNGNQTTLDDVLAHLPTPLKDIAQDLDMGAVEQALMASAKTGRTYMVHVIKGVEPEPEQPAKLQILFTTDQNAGAIRPDGSIDFKERSGLHTVGEGEALGTLHPSVPGIPGKDIFGTPIAPAKAAPPKIRVGQGVEEVESEDGTITYTSNKGGVARFRNDTLEVIELLEIDGDVNYDTGNIRATHGTVRIKGDIKSGFKVDSAEDLIVDGVIEQADVTAGGLVVAGGVIMDGRNTIEAKGNVSAHFFHNAKIKAGGDVTADQDVSHCHIEAGGSVTITGGKGIISGGHIISRKSIRANIIGNKSGVKTCVEIRIPRPSEKTIRKAKLQLQKELNALDKAIGKDADLSSLMNAPEEDRRILAELIKVRGRLQRDIRDIEESRTNFHETIKEEIAAANIKADQRIYSGSSVIICDVTHQVASDRERTVFRLDMDNKQIVTS